MPKSILVVDDDTILCSELTDVLRENGYYVDPVSDGKSAEALAQADNYDLYILDYKMENITGIDFLKILKANGSKAPVLIVSGKPNIDKLIKRENISQYVSEYISKPFDIDKFLQKIREL